jgi:protein TonB
MPAPPTRFTATVSLKLFEGWMFNDNGQFQLQTLHSPQATSIN